MIALVLVASLLTGCSKSVVVPREDLTKDEYRKDGDYRIKLHGWNEYHARRFSITDSTVVIEELKQSDDRYELKKYDMPIVIPREQVEYIGEMKTNWPVTGLISGACLAIAYYVWAASGLSGLD